MTCPCRQLAGRSWISPPPKIATAGTDMKPTARVLAIILIATPSIRNSPLPARYQKVPVTTSSSRWPAGKGSARSPAWQGERPRREHC